AEALERATALEGWRATRALAAVAHVRGDVAEAARRMAEAAREAPAPWSAGTAAQAGRWFLDAGEPEAALAPLQAAVEADPERRRAWRWLAEARRATGDAEGAAEAEAQAGPAPSTAAEAPAGGVVEAVRAADAAIVRAWLEDAGEGTDELALLRALEAALAPRALTWEIAGADALHVALDDRTVEVPIDPEGQDLQPVVTGLGALLREDG
ncbi:MAG: hypothetical protein R3263_12930, partial [Myxococcota bacterium]|nr:hypothetical protein [Myxococcota bacterium]